MAYIGIDASRSCLEGIDRDIDRLLKKNKFYENLGTYITSYFYGGKRRYLFETGEDSALYTSAHVARMLKNAHKK